MQRIFDAVQNGYAFLVKHPQLIFTIILIIVIPVAFLISGQQFLSVSQENEDRLQKDRIGILQDVFVSLGIASEFDRNLLESHITHVTNLNPDIAKLRFAVEEDGEFMIIAAHDVDLIDTIDEEGKDFYRLSGINTEESIIFEIVEDGGRSWQAYRAIPKEPDMPNAFVMTEVSLAQIDALFEERIRTAYLYLAGIIFIILLLIARHVRLIDYGYLYRELKRADEMKDVYTNVTAHELRAPLTAIRGYASIIREDETLKDETREQGKRIETSAGRLLSLINDLLDLARIQSGKLSMEKREVYPSKVASAVVNELKPIAKEKGLQLSHRDESGGTILADNKRLHQALVNLINNSIKYTEQGSVTVVSRSDDTHTTVRIEDTGIGMSSTDQQKLFAPFFRAENEKVHAETGTGLGMWITKQLIEEMGGTLGVESIQDVGTHVVVTFPRSDKVSK